VTLTVADKHHWSPIPSVMVWLTKQIGPSAKVLEVGPGHAPFERADAFVDFVDVPAVAPRPLYKCDMGSQPLPFRDKSFDFIFCRHTLEDMYNPFPLCAEMSRVGKAGYIETPSPIAELCRGVDGNAPPYRGYHHHRYMAWEHAGELRFVSKYPLVEYLKFDEGQLAQLLRLGPKYWNTYYLWEDRINVKHRQSPLDFDIPRDYGAMLVDAAHQAVASADEFFGRGIDAHSPKIVNLKPAYA
jgi:hypothetical protein